MDTEQPKPRKPGTFQKGHKVHRPKGVPNKIPRGVKEALLRAGESIGFDGKGSGGLPGFFEAIGREDKNALGNMICKTLPLEVRQDLNITSHLLLSAPAYITMRVELMQALAPYPEARTAVASVLHAIEATPDDDAIDEVAA